MTESQKKCVKILTEFTGVRVLKILKLLEYINLYREVIVLQIIPKWKAVQLERVHVNTRKQSSKQVIYICSYSQKTSTTKINNESTNDIRQPMRQPRTRTKKTSSCALDGGSTLTGRLREAPNRTHESRFNPMLGRSLTTPRARSGWTSKSPWEARKKPVPVSE